MLGEIANGAFIGLDRWYKERVGGRWVKVWGVKIVVWDGLGLRVGGRIALAYLLYGVPR